MSATQQLSDLSTIELALFLSEFVTLAIALAISYVAFRGYRRNESRPMFFIALGFVLVVGVPATAGLLLLFTGVGGPVLTGLLSQVSEITGMAAILYALTIE